MSLNYPKHGSRLRELIDRPIDAQLLADIYFEVTVAIQRWESRVRLQHVAARMDTLHVRLDLAVRCG